MSFLSKTNLSIFVLSVSKYNVERPSLSAFIKNPRLLISLWWHYWISLTAVILGLCFFVMWSNTRHVKLIINLLWLDRAGESLMKLLSSRPLSQLPSTSVTQLTEGFFHQNHVPGKSERCFYFERTGEASRYGARKHWTQQPETTMYFSFHGLSLLCNLMYFCSGSVYSLHIWPN